MFYLIVSLKGSSSKIQPHKPIQIQGSHSKHHATAYCKHNDVGIGIPCGIMFTSLKNAFKRRKMTVIGCVVGTYILIICKHVKIHWRFDVNANVVSE